MTITDIQKQRVAILGFGQEGQAIARYLHKHSAVADIIEAKSLDEWSEDARQLAREIDWDVIQDGISDHVLGKYEVIFRSPGFPRRHPALLKAETNGATVTSQTQWFFEHTSATIIGVTGTKGKGTTSSLIYQILRSDASINGNVYLTGDIGKDQPLDFIDLATDRDFVVYELSSFQLQDLTISPQIGVCLMVTSDHLDYHSSLEEYHAAKTAIVKYQSSQDTAIYNADYPASQAIGRLGNGQKYSITKEGGTLSGATIEHDMITIYNVFEGDAVLDCASRKLRGAHNLENIAAAAVAAGKLGVSISHIQAVLKDFPGLEHRLQFVDEVGGVAYYNDSISTVPETAVAAIASFTEPVIPILGGSDKGLSYEVLADQIASSDHAIAVAVLGTTGKIIKQLLISRGFARPIIEGDTFADTLRQVARAARPGDVVVLSPASASFDMFKNYADRGHQFVSFVRALKNSS